MPKMTITPPVVQVAIDVLTVDEALRIAEAAVRAGVDWLEAGTPLITFAGTSCIGALSRAFPQMPILADYKAMDGVRKYVLETAKQGGHIATVCAVASDASIRTAVQAGQDAQIAIISDLYAAPDVPQRAAQVEAMGVDSLYVHWGADQRAADPDHDPQADLRPVIERVRVPVGVATFSVEDGIRAFRQGAAIAVIGVPLIQETDVEGALRDYVERAKAAYRPV
jgi:3-hexulose-6-phosphate synthase